MIRCLAFCICWLYSYVVVGQCTSLIPNGGFEQFSSLPDDDCGWSLALGWTNAATTSECNTNNGTPDYFHLQGTGPFASLPVNYFSDLLPFEGSAVMGVGGNVSLDSDAREYISIGLTSPMQIGNEYTLSFSMTIGTPQVGGNYTDGWGVLLSNGPVFQATGTNDPLPAPGNLILIPEVFASETWQTFTFTITADQAYTQFTFGNFFTDAEQTTISYGTQGVISLAYVFVDDFRLEDNNNSDISINLGPDQELCSLEILLDATVSDALSYEWNTGDTTPTITVISPGTYIVEVTGPCGAASDTLSISACPPLTVDLGPDLSVCSGAPLNVQALVSGGIAPYTYNWNSVNLPNIGSSIDVLPLSNQAYSVEVTDAAGNVAADTLQVSIVPELSEANLGEDLEICPGETITIDAAIEGALGYVWNTGSSAPSIEVTGAGIYVVQWTGVCGSLSDTLLVTNGEIAIGAYDSQFVLCDSNTLLIGPEANGPNYSWADGAPGEFPRAVNTPGIYPFLVTDACGTRTFEIKVNPGNCDCTVFIPNSFTPNNDALNETFVPICDCDFVRFDFQVFNRYGEVIYATNDPNEPWLGNYRSSTDYYVPDGIYVWRLLADAKSSDGEIIVHDITGTVLVVR